MTRYKISEEALREAVKTSISIAETLKKLNIIPAGGNYQSLKAKLKKLNITTEHFKGQAWSKQRNFGPKRLLDDYLSNKISIKSHSLKKRLFSSFIFEKRCQHCFNIEWLSKPIALELHHKDGNSSNNVLSNLEILCPNCHALTSNYRGRKKSSLRSPIGSRQKA